MEQVSEAVVSQQLPAGTYYVGDPSYVCEDHSLWLQLLESVPEGIRNERIIQASAQGQSFTAASTAYGDGVYEDQWGNRYPVDTGLIGVVYAGATASPLSGVVLHEFHEPFTVAYQGGLVMVGGLTIDTGLERS